MVVEVITIQTTKMRVREHDVYTLKQSMVQGSKCGMYRIRFRYSAAYIISRYRHRTFQLTIMDFSDKLCYKFNDN